MTHPSDETFLDRVEKWLLEEQVLWQTVTAPIADLLRLVALARRAPCDEIDCPYCGVTVKQVSSATLGLALSQHLRWVCHIEARRAPALTPRDLEVAALLCERWGMWTFKTGVRAHVPDGGSFVTLDPALLSSLIQRLREAAFHAPAPPEARP
jgi:hypothetical protein